MGGLNIAIVGGSYRRSLGMAWRAAPRAHWVIGTCGGCEAGDEAVAGRMHEPRVTWPESLGLTSWSSARPSRPSCLRYELLPRASGCIVTDAGSTNNISASRCGRRRDDVPFIGGHPMAGPSGWAGAADPYLFQNAVYVLTLNEDTPAESPGSSAAWSKRRAHHRHGRKPRSHRRRHQPRPHLVASVSCKLRQR